MPFQPRLAQEILQEMVGQFVAQTDATDVAEGSVLVTLLGTVAEQLEAVEFRLKRIRDSYDLNKVTGADLAERVKELPGSSLQEIPSSAASGTVLSITRGTTTSSLLLPQGSLFGRSDAPDILYATASDNTFAIGVATLTNVRVICLRRGPEGNAPAGTIDKIVNAPDDIIGVVQTSRISGGQAKESSSELRNRAKAYLSSLAVGQPEALRAAALSFVDTSGVRVRHADVFEDLENPAYSELVVDDGTGMAGLTQPMATASGTIPVQGTIQLNHQAPLAVRYVDTITVNGSPLTYAEDANPTWVSIPERGIIQLKEGQTDISPGDTWSISGYDVFTGYIAELQPIIEGSSSVPNIYWGKRASGTRVRVVPPEPYYIDVSVNLILRNGVVVADAIAATKDTIEEFFLRLGPGDVLYISDLYNTLETSLSQFIEAVDVLSPTENVSPPTKRYSLRASSIEVV